MPTTSSTVSQQVVDSIMDFVQNIQTMPPKGTCLLIVEMSPMTFKLLESEEPSLILGSVFAAYAYRNIRLLKTKLGFPLPEPDGLMSKPSALSSIFSGEVIIYLDKKMKDMKLSMSWVQVTQAEKLLKP